MASQAIAGRAWADRDHFPGVGKMVFSRSTMRHSRFRLDAVGTVVGP
jgi:hypothetical protein